MPSSSIASANTKVKSVLECRSHKPRSQTSSLLSVYRKREVSKLNVGVILIIAIHEISNRENVFDVNSRNIRPSKITHYTVAELLENHNHRAKATTLVRTDILLLAGGLTIPCSEKNEFCIEVSRLWRRSFWETGKQKITSSSCCSKNYTNL